MALTKFKEGSARELLSVSLPLMLSCLSFVLMIFFDRMFLANYSIEALNAVVIAGTFCWGLIEPIRIITSMAEVFVAQYNGAGRVKELGRPVWQMVWLSLFSILCCFLFAFLGVPFFFKSVLQQEYAFWIMLFSPATFLVAALSAFYIGRGKTKVIILLSVGSNVINILLDVVLIFGIDGIIPSLGVKGAAIATNIGQIFQVLILFALFSKRTNRKKYNTSNYKFDFSLFVKCIRMGLPLALALSAEIMAYGVFYEMMSAISVSHITIASICQTALIAFFFVGEGMYQGACAVAGNFIGAMRHDMIPKVLKAGLKIYLVPIIVATILFVVFPSLLINLFLRSSNIDENLLAASMIPSLKTCFVFVLFSIIFIWFRLLLSGVLTAAGDVMFQSIAAPIITWCLLILPVYFFVLRSSASIEFIYFIVFLASVFPFVAYYFRYQFGSWRNIELVHTG